jgi:diguanylate cyclase (GGDEF)-like protein
MRSFLNWILGAAVPLVAVAVLLYVDSLDGTTNGYVGLIAVMPMFSAVFGTPVTTVIVSVTTLAAAFVMGELYPETSREAQTVRVVVIALVGAIAIAASFIRQRRDLALRTARIEAERVAVLDREAHTDPLTGLLNRRGLQWALKSSKAQLKAVAILDIDGFKDINDGYGHGVGDEYLENTAKRLVNAVSSSDLVCRWGGDEFLVVITGAVDDPLGIIERALTQVTGRPFSTSGGLIRASLCAGVAQLQPGELVDTAIDRADEALYRAKHDGDGVAVLAANPSTAPPLSEPPNQSGPSG